MITRCLMTRATGGSCATSAVKRVTRRTPYCSPTRTRCAPRPAHSPDCHLPVCHLTALPAAVTFRVRLISDVIPQCLPHFPVLTPGNDVIIDTGRVYRLFLLCIQYFGPLLIICVAYFRIIHKLWLSKAPGSVVEQRDAIMHKNKIKVSSLCRLLLDVGNLLKS